MRKLLLALALAGTLTGAAAQAHEVQPMIVTVGPVGEAAAFRLMVKNTETVPITLELEAMRVTVSAEGAAVRTPENDDIILFPPQIIVAPGAEQAVQVQYVGDPDIDTARIYAIEVRQLPINLSQTSNAGGATTEVKVAFNFISHMIVSPPGATAEVTVSESARAPEGGLSFVATNAGKGVALLKDSQWVATDTAGAKVELDIDTLDYGGFAALLPGASRTIKAPAGALAGLQGAATVAAVKP